MRCRFFDYARFLEFLLGPRPLLLEVALVGCAPEVDRVQIKFFLGGFELGRIERPDEGRLELLDHIRGRPAGPTIACTVSL